MQELKVTAPGPGHYHIAYTNSASGAAAMTPAQDGHSHELMYDPPREPRPPAPAIPPQIDPMTGMPMMVPDPQNPESGVLVPDPGTPEDPGDPGKEEGSWIISPGEDGHEHILTDYRTDPPKSTETEDDVLKDCLALWREALEITSDCRKKGREAEDFYQGKQWDSTIERELNALNRAALTINEIGPNIDTLLGYQMEQRTDIKFLAQEDSDQKVADMLNVIVKKVLDSCYYQREESKVFKDQCVPGMAAFNIYMNFENIQGDIKVERFPWDDIVYGPHEKEDLSDCEYEVRSRMYSIAKLKQLHGKKANEIEESYKHYSGQYPDVEKGDNGVAGEHTDYRNAKKLDDMPFTVDGTLPLVDVQKKQFRLAQVTRKTYKEVTVIFNQEENFFFTAYDWKEKDIALASQLPGFQVISQIKTRMRITKFCGQVILSDENPADLPLHDFYTVPVYGYRQNGEYWGKVEWSKDPQRELNKRRSQIMDIMNRLGASVYYTTPETFIDSQEEEKFKKGRSKPGAIFKINDAGNKPVLEEGAELPNGLVQIMQLDQENLQRLMNIVLAPPGPEMSGIAMIEQKKSRLTGNLFLFDNLSFAKQKLGRLIVALVQRYYPPERLERLLTSQYSKSKFQIGGQDYAEFSKEQIIEMLENTDLLENDVVVAESAFAPSTRLGIAMQLFEMMQKGAAIPPELPLQFIDMPADIKAQISDTLAQQSEMAAQEAATTSQTEVMKTLLAKGQYTVTPEKAQEMGLVPVNGLPGDGTGPNNGYVNGSAQVDELAANMAGPLAG